MFGSTDPMSDLPMPPVSNNPPRKSRLRLRGANRAPPGTRLDPLSSAEFRGTTGGPDGTGALPEPTERRGVCESLLMEGNVQSFVDCFYLTHRPDPVQLAALQPGEEAGEIDVPLDELLFLRDHLTGAENARRQGDTGTVYGSYSALAQHYHGQGDMRTSVYFYQKCLEIARLTGDSRGEMAANHDLGLMHQAMRDAAGAAPYHERHLALATKEDADGEMRVAGAELVKVYRALAEHCENGTHAAATFPSGHNGSGSGSRGGGGGGGGEPDVGLAVGYYQRCLEAAVAARGRRAEGLANYRLGRCFVLLGDCVRAIPALEEFEAICQETVDKEGETMACAALASAYVALQNDDKAVEYLQAALEMATETGNLALQGEACAALGVIHNKRKEFDQAVHFFERNFDIARTTNNAAVAAAAAAADPTTPGGGGGGGGLIGGAGGGSGGDVGTAAVDVARVYVGMARGNAMLKRYVHAIDYDMKSLLAWKTDRRDLPKPTSKKKSKKKTSKGK